MAEEIPAFDSTIFCLGSVGRGERWYRYIVHSNDTVVDLYMHSPRSSHIVYKKVLDEALLNLRIGRETSGDMLKQYLLDLNATQAAIRAGYSPGAPSRRARS